MESLEPEVLFSFYYRDLIPAAILAMPRLGAFNMHGSLLPRYRGRACVNWAIIHGETETGATLHWMTPRPDEGDIVDQERVPIGEKDTALDVMLKVADAAEKVLTRSLPLIEAGKAPRIPQDGSKATYWREEARGRAHRLGRAGEGYLQPGEGRHPPLPRRLHLPGRAEGIHLEGDSP